MDFPHWTLLPPKLTLKIVFICGSLEAGKDGVGDYTRRLAAECIRNRHECRIVALNDRHMHEDQILRVDLMDVDTAVQCLRCSSSVCWDKRIQEVRQWIGEFKPDWLSLQFVPFAFHDKGLPVGLSKRLTRLADKCRWHIMFHECWVASLGPSSWKEFWWGKCQKLIIAHLIRTIKPVAAHTHALPYQQLLQSLMPEVERLQLFGNIPVGRDRAEAQFMWNELRTMLPNHCKDWPRARFHLAGVFGAVHREWDVRAFASKWAVSLQSSERVPVIVFFGRGLEPAGMHRTQLECISQSLHVLALGQLCEDKVAALLKLLDFGMSTTPWALTEKSGSVAAFLDFGLSVVVTREEGADIYPMPPGIERASLLEPTRVAGLRRTRLPTSRLQEVTFTFLTSLSRKS